jgi:putative hydrolase of the HAD superfamily
MVIKAVFLDIGNVLLTNGWDRRRRQAAAEKFGLDQEEMNERHHLTFDAYEEGKLSLDEYLTRLVFYEDRPFTREDFKTFMFAQSQPKPEMIDLITRLKARYGFKVATVSNEGRELTIYRIKKVQFDILCGFLYFFVLCPHPQTRRRPLPPGSGLRSGDTGRGDLY